MMDAATLEGLRGLIAALRERADDYDTYFGVGDEQLMQDAARTIELFIEAALGSE
jgi:hypothetical protein